MVSLLDYIRGRDVWPKEARQYVGFAGLRLINATPSHLALPWADDLTPPTSWGVRCASFDLHVSRLDDLAPFGRLLA
jgi:hypothetical protein